MKHVQRPNNEVLGTRVQVEGGEAAGERPLEDAAINIDKSGNPASAKAKESKMNNPTFLEQSGTGNSSQSGKEKRG